MFNENRTDFLYLADTLPLKYPEFYSKFENILIQNKITFSLLPATKDVWCRDYMPVRNGLREYVKFEYAPDYLLNKKYRNTITDSSFVCQMLNIKIKESTLKVDGGNLIHYGSKVILCDKVLKENPNLEKKELVECLRWILRKNNVILIPTPPDDMFGHSDGVVRFVKSNLVLINKYGIEDQIFKKSLLKVLQKYKLQYIEIPYNPYENKNEIQANGTYLNFLQMKGVVFVPIFNQKEDQEAIELFRRVFPKEKVISVESGEIADDGGILNCISWNIQRNMRSLN